VAYSCKGRLCPSSVARRANATAARHRRSPRRRPAPGSPIPAVGALLPVPAPLLTLGDLEGATQAWAAADARFRDASAEAVETGLRVVTILARRGQIDRAALARQALPEVAALPRWLQGWQARIEVSHLGPLLDDARWTLAFVAAWGLNQGYGFQRRLLLVELAASARRWEPDFDDEMTRASLVRAVAAEHCRRYDRRPCEYPDCHQAPLPQRAAHALGLQLGRREDFCTTLARGVARKVQGRCRQGLVDTRRVWQGDSKKLVDSVDDLEWMAIFCVEVWISRLGRTRRLGPWMLRWRPGSALPPAERDVSAPGCRVGGRVELYLRPNATSRPLDVALGAG